MHQSIYFLMFNKNGILELQTESQYAERRGAK
jgi:hypothetical protein